MMLKKWISAGIAAAMLLSALPMPVSAVSAGNEVPVRAAVRGEDNEDDEEDSAVTTDTTETTTSTTETTTSTTETTTSTTETTTYTTATTATTAPTAPAPRFYAVCDRSYPQGDTLLHIYLAENAGLEAFGMSVKLPDCLTPIYNAAGEAEFCPTDALSDTAYAYYAPATHTLSLAYASMTAGAATEELGYFRLHIGADAKVGSVYALLLDADADSFSMVGADTADCKTLCTFAPVAPLQRTLSETAVTLTEQDGTHPLTLSPEPPAGSCKWSSSDPSVVSVDENGVLSAHANGSVIVSVTCETLTYTCEVTAAIAREISQTELTVEELNGIVELSLVPAPLHAPVWSSDDESIVRITEDGRATVTACGKVWLTALCEGTEYRYEVTATIVRALNVTQYTFHDKSEMIRLFLTPTSYNATAWLSDDPNVARVNSSGVVTPVANGTATILGSCEGYEFTCVITVDLKMALNYTAYAAKEAGSTLQLTLTPEPADPTEITWQSSDETIAAVDENGLVTFHSEGDAEITAEYRGTVYTCAVTLQSYLRGDVNGDGVVDTKDSMLALRAWNDVYVLYEPMPLTAIQFRAADVDENGELTLSDTMAILRYFSQSLTGLSQDWDTAINPKKQREDAE